MRELGGKVAVVTGAASGIGRALSLRLAGAGCRLALADIHAEGLATIADEVRARNVPVSTHRIDVSDKAAMAALPGEVLAAHGAVHVLVNNAGVTVTAPFLEHSEDDFEWVVGINLWGVVHGCRFFLPHLLAQPEANIVNLSSIFGVIGAPAQTAYCATKFAVRGFSESLAEELEGTGVRVTVVHPGGVNTNIVASARSSDADAQKSLAAFFARKAMSPDAAAARILRGIQRDERRVLITPEAHFMDAIKRLMPQRGNQISSSLLVRTLGLSAFQRRWRENLGKMG